MTEENRKKTEIAETANKMELAIVDERTIREKIYSVRGVQEMSLSYNHMCA